MKIKVVSDIHLEFDPPHRVTKFKVPYDNEDYLILAGDVQVGLYEQKWFVDLLKRRPVIYVVGNHEYYHKNFDFINANLLKFEETVNKYAKEYHGWTNKLTILHTGVRDSLEVDGYLFCGGTLWTDFDNSFINMSYAQRLLNDFSVISKTEDKRHFTPEDALEEHKKTKESITNILSNETNLKKIVVTHHAPSYRSIHERFANSLANSCYASHLDALVEKADLWAHGHTHTSFDYNIGNCRVVCNPRGYYDVEENPIFEPHKIIEI